MLFFVHFNKSMNAGPKVLFKKYYMVYMVKIFCQGTKTNLGDRVGVSSWKQLFSKSVYIEGGGVKIAFILSTWFI